MKVRRTRERAIIFHVTDEEKEKVISLARERDISISELCRKLLMCECKKSKNISAQKEG